MTNCCDAWGQCNQGRDCPARTGKVQPHQAAQHKVTLKGYGLCLGGNTLHERALMEYETFALMPLKSGGNKPKKEKGSMVFSFCPFCGVDARVKPAEVPA